MGNKFLEKYPQLHTIKIGDKLRIINREQNNSIMVTVTEVNYVDKYIRVNLSRYMTIEIQYIKYNFDLNYFEHYL
jgi:hypothetical protein